MRSVILKVTTYPFSSILKKMFEDKPGFYYKLLIHFWAKIELPS